MKYRVFSTLHHAHQAQWGCAESEPAVGSAVLLLAGGLSEQHEEQRRWLRWIWAPVLCFAQVLHMWSL